MRIHSLPAAFLICASCDAAPQTPAVADSTEQSSSAKGQEAKAPTTTDCDAAKLTALAESIGKERAAWTAASGKPVSRAEDVLSGMKSACAAEVLAPLSSVFDNFEQADRGFPLYATSKTGPVRTVCPKIDTVSKAAAEVAGPDRSGHVFDACDLGRFPAIVSRDEFVGTNANTGAVAFIGLSQSLQDAGGTKASSEVLSRELVLASGLLPTLPEGLDLPSAAGGEQLVHGYSVAIFSGGRSTGPTFQEFSVFKETGALFDRVSEWEEESAVLGSSGKLLLFADRGTPWAELAPVIATLKQASSKAPRLVVLGNAEGNPLRSIPLPEVRDPGSKTVQDVLNLAR